MMATAAVPAAGVAKTGVERGDAGVETAGVEAAEIESAEIEAVDIEAAVLEAAAIRRHETDVAAPRLHGVGERLEMLGQLVAEQDGAADLRRHRRRLRRIGFEQLGDVVGLKQVGLEPALQGFAGRRQVD